MSVDKPRSDYDAIKDKWHRLRDCYNGRDAILKSGAKYVPDLPGLNAAENTAYRFRGNFYNALTRTVHGMNGAIFQEAPEVDMLETLKEGLDDLTLTSMPFETFAMQSGREVFLTGRYGVLVDLPKPEPTGAENGTEPADNTRPYCVGYRAEDIINWRTERRGGDDVLTMVVLSEQVETYTPDDQFTCVMVQQYRVVQLDPAGNCIVQLWRQKTKDSKFEPYDPPAALVRRGQSLRFVPFVFLGTLTSSSDLDRPPLLDLGDVNLGHWRNSVDFEHGLHLVALPTPWIAGAKNSQGTTIAMGPSVVLELDVQGTAGMMEFTGSGLKAIADAMTEKKLQMASIGARLLEDSPKVAETLGATRMRHTGETASLKTIAQALEQGLTQILQIFVWWQTTDATPVEADVDVSLNKEYIDIRATPQEIQVALTALQAGEISYETFYNILAEGGWAREGVDVEQEQKDIATRKLNADEPPIDPSLSPGETKPPAPAVPAAAAPKTTKTITGPDGKVKYVVTEG